MRTLPIHPHIMQEIARQREHELRRSARRYGQPEPRRKRHGSVRYRTGWLLNFDGTSGYYLALAEFVVILAALVASTLHSTAFRQAGLLVLLAWSVVWFAGAARMLMGAQEWAAVACTAATALAVAATYSRTRRRWSPPPRLDDAPPSTIPKTPTA